MTTRVHTSRVSRVLGLVPARVLAALDAWSYRVALRRAERRRLGTTARRAGTATIVAQTS